MSIKFITCIYSDLFGSDLGGRPGRNGHYRWSLLSLLKMSDADFLCYTSDREIESLKEFFYVNHQVSPEKLEFRVYDIYQTKYQNLIKILKSQKEAIDALRFNIQSFIGGGMKIKAMTIIFGLTRVYLIQG
jgi:hypothetical protein